MIGLPEISCTWMVFRAEAAGCCRAVSLCAIGGEWWSGGMPSSVAGLVCAAEGRPPSLPCVPQLVLTHRAIQNATTFASLPLPDHGDVCPASSKAFPRL